MNDRSAYEPAFEPVAENIYRLLVPFENLFTSVFAIDAGGKTVLFDAATNAEDVTRCILPALHRAHLVPDMIVCSHFHDDHCGGEPALAAHFPQAVRAKYPVSSPAAARGADAGKRLLSDGEILFGVLEVLSLPGHTTDAMALVDRRTMTALTADCLQLCGIGRFGTGVTDAAAYLRSIERVRARGLYRIVASHEYVPLGSIAEGPEAVGRYLDECERYIGVLRSYARRCAQTAMTFEEIAERYNAEHPDLPTLSPNVFESAAALPDSSCGARIQ